MHTTPVAERELTLGHARQRIDKQLSDLSLSVTERWVGTAVGSAEVTLSDAVAAVSQGWGKGLEHEARVGAHYEALEHHLDHFHPRRVHFSLASRLADLPALRDDFLQPWLEAQPDKTLACQSYLGLNGDWLFDYPLALSKPGHADQPFTDETFDYRGLRRYSSNDSSAIGATFHEAVLHALNQSIERDALSLFFLRTYYYQQQPNLSWVCKPDSQTELGRIWRTAEECLEGEVKVLDISSEFISRSYLALRVSPDSTLHGALFGAGSSLDPWHGVRRAVTELVQVQFNARAPGAMDDLNLADSLLRPYPRLHACLQLDIETLKQVPARDVGLPPPVARASVAEQVDRLWADLRRHGLQPGICEVFRGMEGISLVNVVVPGLERFHLVCTGNVVCPGPRGRAMGPRQP
ncbi:YcaO-like family protein [Pseudomonas sp. S75]|uniref:YcaO-like family protein n=1 Tax=unclassified Pseudomonas TaxID=196821 RepID=UPI0019034212|nr:MULTISPECIES: YcaO-like family protein [unclassified Pseudomonas]MBJ9974334.1 YcaO-like family protein [Pseudomonas sp. S30]MBK0151736.1 YcaO-like family protein [Pseudomonas sp. S75]